MLLVVLHWVLVPLIADELIVRFRILCDRTAMGLKQQQLLARAIQIRTEGVSMPQMWSEVKHERLCYAW